MSRIELSHGIHWNLPLWDGRRVSYELAIQVRVLMRLVELANRPDMSLADSCEMYGLVGQLTVLYGFGAVTE